MKTIQIIDYGMGNLRSVAKACEHIGATPRICTTPSEIDASGHLILPGVGAFRDAHQHLLSQGFIEPVLAHMEAERPFLGICLGLQLLFERSYEDGIYEGLGVIPGEVVKFTERPGLKIPHMGWNQLVDRRPENPLLQDLPDSAWFYFVHSYHVVPTEASVVAARTEHGEKVVAMVQRGNLFATQFHPEKSQQHGLQLLQNFANL